MKTWLRFRMVGLVAFLVAACNPPPIEGTGGKGGGNGGAGHGTTGAGGAGGAKNGGAGPDFTVSFPDAGARDGAASPDDAALDDANSCAGEIHEGKLVPVDLLFLLDTSGSMEESSGMKSKWMAMRQAIQSFIKDPQSAGLGVGLETFPIPSRKCTKDSECGGGKEICGQKGACGAAADAAKAEFTCFTVSPKCIDGQDCRRFGLCAQSGLRCTGIGRACPGAPATDVCTDRARYCTDRGEASCAPTLYETPIVPIADLPGVQPALETALTAIVPDGATPTTPAVTGALAQLRTRAQASGGRKQLLVLATDGMPTTCDPNTVDTAATALAAARAGNPAIATYVIGIFTDAQLMRARPALEQLATAGGTGVPFILTTGNDLTQKFIDAINQIRGAAVGCEFSIPKPAVGTLDFDKVNVRVTSAAGNQGLPYVGSADRCDPAKGGWYYDVDPTTGTPTKVLLCEASCSKTKSTPGVSVELRFGCKTIVIQ